jgi:malate dehydrogenase (oxaloacetate-decarboxylating)(NADP+)
MATGRSDYPNQVNNVLCFPFIFRGALDAGATTITEHMKLAAVRALAELAQAESSDVGAKAYGGESQRFGPEYLIPRPFDPRLRHRRAGRGNAGNAGRPVSHPAPAGDDRNRDRIVAGARSSAAAR